MLIKSNMRWSFDGAAQYLKCGGGYTNIHVTQNCIQLIHPQISTRKTENLNKNL